MKLKLSQVIFFLCVLVFLTSSFDIFLNIKLGGFSLRFAFIVIIIQAILFLFYLIKTNFKKPIKFLGFIPFFIWCLFLIAFLPNTTILSRNIGYLLWLGLFTAFIIILPYFIDTEEKFIKTIKWYLWTFLFVSIFGLIQFACGMVGIDILIEQWWLNGRLPRINAFSYEPSYFTSYILMAWVLCFFMMIDKNKLASYFNARTAFLIFTISLLLSTSRMGLIFIFLIVLGYLFNQVKTSFITFKIKKKAISLVLTFVSAILFIIFYITFYFDKIKFMFIGMGLYGYASHSTTQRVSEFTDTIEAFLRSPFIGYSLGGIPSAIAEVRGTRISTQVQTKDFEGMSIFAETLAASGIFGFIFFISFLVIVFYKTNKLVKQLRPINPQFSNLLYALLLGLLFELLILNMNQNILRTYLWVHLGIVNLGYFIGRDILKKSLKEDLKA